MWLLRAYSSDDDELVDELSLDGLRLADGRRILGEAPTTLGSNPLTLEQAQDFAKTFGLELPTGDIEFFLDQDSEPSESGSRGARDAGRARVTA